MIEYVIAIRDTENPGLVHVETGIADMVGIDAERERWVDEYSRRTWSDNWDHTFHFTRARSHIKYQRPDDGTIPFAHQELTTGTPSNRGT